MTFWSFMDDVFKVSGVVGEGPATPEGPACGAGGDGPTPSVVFPPDGNTGGKVADTLQLVVHLDWLSVTFPSEKRQEVVSLLAPKMGEPEESGALKFYGASLEFATGARIGYKGKTANLKESDHLSLNGASLALFEAEEQMDLVRELASLGARASRLDIAVDDYERVVSMDQVHAAAEAGHYAGFRKYRPVRSFKRDEGLDGDTANLGSRGGNGAGKYLRVYDKRLESGGEVDCIRWELELSDERAREAFKVLGLVQSVEMFRNCLTCWVGGAVEFVEREAGASDRHLDRCQRLPWWERFLELLGQAKLKVTRHKPTLQKSLEYLAGAFGRVVDKFSAVVEEMGYQPGEVLMEMFKRRGPRASDRQREAAKKIGLDIEALLHGAAGGSDQEFDHAAARIRASVRPMRT